MDLEKTAFIRGVSTLEDEDGNSVDAITLTDDRVLAIDGDSVVLYDNISQLQEALDGADDRPHIALS